MSHMLLNSFNRLIPVQEIRTRLSAQRTILQLNGGAGSVYPILSHLVAENKMSLVVITPDDDSAASWASDLQQLGREHVYYFPSTRLKPYDTESLRDNATLVQRSEIAGHVKDQSSFLMTTSIIALSEKILSAELFDQETLKLSKGDHQSPDALRASLVDQDYSPVQFVEQPGEFAVRGGIFDIWSFGSDYPVRIEFFGDEIDSLREFDPDSQRSISFLEEIRLLPNVSFRNRPSESLFRYLSPNTVVWMHQPGLIEAEHHSLFQQAETAYEQVRRSDSDEALHSLSTPSDRYVSPDDLQVELSRFPLIQSGGFTSTNVSPVHAATLTPIAEESLMPVEADAVYSIKSTPHPEFGSKFSFVKEYLQQEQSAGNHVMILCDNASQKERFEELLSDDELPDVTLLVLSLHEGFVLPAQNGFPGVSVLTDHQIFHRFHRAKLKKKRVHGGISLKELRDLNIGDYVVHVDYGIGKFEGFKQIKVRDTVQESAVVRYQEDSILYVNVTSLHKLQKYSGKEGAEPQITRLGSGEWQRKKQKTRSRLQDIARELIQLYAARKSQQAYAFDPDNTWQREMEARFEFEETPDQLKAIEAVKEDMESEQPMDRLVCGDVGFGKTEVAIRAAFKAVMGRKQVALLVPTTILADQHYKTFSKRMKEFPVRVEVISRFVPAAKQKEILKDLVEGKVDILIGTHRLVSKDVKFADLGLLIIDEEQRFGVAAKDKLKKFRVTVDVLTLTATPIPRTLQFSLMGARDLSIIQTPPPNRQPVYTEIHAFNQELIAEAIQQEITRGGQVFFIHNRIQSIEELGDLVRILVPEVRLRVAHGQMAATQLETIIQDFYQHKFDVLLSTNIVENGIDISNANTILINNAHSFGLSELHQLRGRVGRSDRKAFCYLITPPLNELSAESRRRLTALEEFSDLGAGFHIAMRDLDIRGAGDLLGAEQSGFINDIGFELYTKILNETVQELKETEFSSLFEKKDGEMRTTDMLDGHESQLENENGIRMESAHVSKRDQIEFEALQHRDTRSQHLLPASDTALDFDETALLDETYIRDSVERINLYRKLAGAETLKELHDWKDEVTDRFGPFAGEADALFRATKIKWLAAQWAIKKVTIRAGKIWLQSPESDSKQGKLFYDKGLFQDLIQRMQSREEFPFQLAQKENVVRLIASNLNDLEAVERYLSELYAERYGAAMEEILPRQESLREKTEAL